MFNMFMWLNDMMIILEYEEIHFPLVLSYQWLILLRNTPFDQKMRFKGNIITQIKSA
jgi:hypothetical protein